jgi:hypothetical protein
LLRSHELIHRVPKTNYYRLNKKGQTEMMTALQFRITDLALLGLEKLCQKNQNLQPCSAEVTNSRKWVYKPKIVIARAGGP